MAMQLQSPESDLYMTKDREKDKDREGGKYLMELKSKVGENRSYRTANRSEWHSEGKLQEEGKSHEKVKRETREETIARIEDVQGQWFRGEISDIV